MYLLDSLEKRAQKHAKDLFPDKTSTSNDSKDTTLSKSSRGENEKECTPLEKSTVKLKTPTKKNFSKSIKSAKKCSPQVSPVSRKEKESSSKMRHTDVNPASEIIMDDGELSSSSDVSEMEGLETPLDQTLERKAQNINLSKRNVKSIIHHLLTNEHVIKLYKDALSAHDTNESPESSAAGTVGTLDCFPKMTRSKVKDFMEKSNIPPSPSKQQRPGPSILDLDFAEEEDDDEYSPERDENNETDDDESVISSVLSEFGSPCPVTPSTPVPHVCHEKPALSMSPINSPLMSSANKLKIDLSACEGLSETEDEGNIALRTRSKKSLTDTSLVDIEQAFVAPDITPDMYDTSCYEDKDWTDFLNSLYKTADESTVDDEVNDPEFNYIAEAEQEALDDEDFRFDKPTKVSRKELNILIEELQSLFEDEVLPLQVVAEASNPQDPISQFVTSNLKETPVTFNYRTDRPPVPLMPPIASQTNSTQKPLFISSQKSLVLSPGIQYIDPGGQVSNSCNQIIIHSNEHINLNSQQINSNSQCLSLGNQISSPDGNFKTPYAPVINQVCIEPLTDNSSSLNSQDVEESEERRIIADNMRKHIQLLTQTFLLSAAKDDVDSCKVANTAKELLTDLHTRKLTVGCDSLFNVCNLDEAIQVVSKPSVVGDGNDAVDKSFVDIQNLKQIELKMTLFNNSVFMYPHLLPKFEPPVKKRKRSKSTNTRIKFLPSEDNLIALGLEQFSDCNGAFPAEFIHKYLVRGKSVNEIYHRIMFLSSSKAGINHVKKLRRLQQPVQLDPPQLHFVDFRPPSLKDSNLLPSWCQELTNAQVSFSVVDDSQGCIVSSTKKHSNRGLITIKPKPTSSLISSEVETHCTDNFKHIPSKSRSSVCSSVILQKTMSSSKSSQSSRKKENKNKKANPSSPPSPSTGCDAVDDHSLSPFQTTSENNPQSPDLLAKTMKSCGITASPNSSYFPSPKSSSTPLPATKLKHSSVKNLSSAFNESEMIATKQNELKKPDKTKDDLIESRLAMNKDQDPSSGTNNGSIQSNANSANVSPDSNSGPCVDKDSPLPSDSSLISEAMDLTLKANTPLISQQLSSSDHGVSDTTHCESEREMHLEKIKNDDNGDSDSQKTGASCKPGMIQFTVIEKPIFKPVQSAIRNMKEKCDKEKLACQPDEKDDVKGGNVLNVSGERSSKGEVSASQPPESYDEPMDVESQDSCEVVKEGSANNSNSPNKLVPWISSMMSQFEDENSPNEKTKVTRKTAIKNISKTPVKENSVALSSDFPELPLELLKSSPIKVDIFAPASSERTPTKLKPVAPKATCSKSVPYVPLPRISPKRKELNRQVRHILPKSFVFETKNPSPTKTTALNLKKKATLLCQKSPLKILPRPPNVPPKTENRSGSLSTMLTRSQGGSKIKKKEEPEPSHKQVKVKKLEDDSESAKETESEASEVEDSGLSQEEDEDKIKLDDLMAASTTISFGSKRQARVQDEDIKTKAEKKRAMSLSLLQPDLIQTDPKKDDRDTAFAQQYFNQVKETLSSDPDRFYKFLSLLKDLNKDHTSPVELYLDIVSLLSDHRQLVEDFSGFLLSFQAVECQCFSTNFQYAQIRQFLRQVEIQCGSSANTYQKVLRALSTWSSMCQEGKLEGGLREKMLSILKNVPGVLDNLISYFLDGGGVTDCHSMDFEDVCLDDEVEGEDEFECVVLPNEREDYNTKSCSCHCHSNSQDERFHRRIKHCISCSLQVYEGQPVLKMSRSDYKPMSVVYPSEELEEKEKLAKAKKEAALICLAKAKVQQQQKDKKRKKELKSTKSKKICKSSDEIKSPENMDAQDKVIMASGSDTNKNEKAKERKKQAKGVAANTKLSKETKAKSRSKASKINEKSASRSKTRCKEGQASKSDKPTKTKTDKPQQKSAVALDNEVSKPTRSKNDGNEKEDVGPPNVEIKESENSDNVQEISNGSNKEPKPVEVDPDGKIIMGCSQENESRSEIFDRFILDMMSDEGLSDTALKSIQMKFPSASGKEIQERAEQLLSLLETMSDASTDVDDSTKIS